MKDNIAYKKLETEEEILMANELIFEYVKWLNTEAVPKPQNG
jgi:hypothetical protein